MQTHSYLKRLYQSAASKLLFFVQLQLFMTLMSLPILIAWGLPISFMSLVGNLIFSPFLTLFLLLSSLLFFFELCYIPNQFLIYGLDWCTRIWSWCIACGDSQWLVGFMKPPFWMLCTILIGSLLILHHKKIINPKVRIISFILFIGLVILVLKWYPQKNCSIQQVSCNNGFVTIIQTGSTLTVIDPGVMGRRVHDNWVEYTLVKEIIEKFGTLKIDNLILTRPTILTLDYAAQICRFMNVRSLYLVTWQGESEKRLLQKYGRLRYELNKKKGTFFRITKELKIISLNDSYTLMLEPLEEQLVYKDISFSSIGITLIEGQSNTLLNLKSY